MSVEELEESTMSPANRTLKKITMEDATKASMTFMTLMGENASLRKDFISANAGRANIDV